MNIVNNCGERQKKSRRNTLPDKYTGRNGFQKSMVFKNIARYFDHMARNDPEKHKKAVSGQSQLVLQHCKTFA